MLRNRKDLLTTKILNSIPKNIKPIEYLIKILGISKESAYRRLRGDIPFTFEEMSKLSLDLNFSMDEFIAKPDESRILINMQTDTDEDLSIVFLKRFEQHYNVLLHLENYPDVETVLTFNRVPTIASVYSKNLFKFFYFKWLHQNQEAALKLCYSDVAISDEMEEMRKKVKFSASNCSNKITVILDSNFFISLINEIRYYRKRRLVNDEAFESLKNEMLDFVNSMESSAQTGIFGPTAKINIYLSSMNIEVNTVYVKYDSSETSYIYGFSINPLSISNVMVCEKHKRWINSVKKYSTLITKSNEMLQSEYFDKQREFIMSLNDKNFSSLY
ncbi:MAG: hypothetical protein LBC48_09875 [Dysgonamonadaceae bacterium]|jgi:hypothetical protein|nr:hypothetical protein [Dysgonamonadaceae bacterium]